MCLDLVAVTGENMAQDTHCAAVGPVLLSSPEVSICSTAWGESPEVLPLRAIDKGAGSSLGYSCSFL